MKLDIQLFADGKVVIDTELNTKDFENGLNKIQSSTKNAGSTVKNIIAGLGITQLIGKAFQVINNSIDDAITRFDTLNNFPKVMSNLGIGAQDAQKSIDKMSDKLAGLPTTLDQGASAVQRFTSANGNVKKSTDIFLALNNAILAGGANTQIQASALEQLSQAYAKGKPDMMEWRTAMMAMPAQIKQVATAMGFGSSDALGEALREGTVSMDDFTDTIVKLNNEGINGFQSFEQQAKNSTGGIQTAITVAKTQVVKGVADMITGINKGLKKNKLPTLSDIIADVGKKAKEALDKVAKIISKIPFKKLFDIVKKGIPIIGGLTTAFLAYEGALKALELGKLITNIGSMATAFINLIPTIGTTTSAMALFNTTLGLSPIGIIIAGVAGLTAGILLLNEASKENKTEVQKMNDVLNEYDKSMQEADKTRQKYLDTHMNELANTEELYEELKLLVDENGKVKEGYEDRAQYVLGELNKALGTEIKMNDGVIEGYKEIRSQMAELIAQKRAKILLDAEEARYNTAKDNAIKLEQEYAEAQTRTNKASAERSKYIDKLKEKYNLTNEQVGQLVREYQVLDENGNAIISRFGKEATELINLTNSYNGQKNALAEAKEAYAENELVIANYEQSIKNLANGNYEAVLKMYEDTTNYQGKTNEETAKNYNGAIDSQKEYLKELKANKDKYDEDVYNALVENHENIIKELEKQNKNVEEETKKTQSATKEIIKQGQSATKDIWNMSLNEQVKTLKDKKVEFKQTADGHIQAYIDGQESGKPRTKKEAEKMIKEIESELKKGEEKAKQTGLALTQGETKGIQQGQGSTFSAVRQYGNSIISNLKSVLKIHSPSKITEQFGIFFTEGFDEGLEDGKKETIKGVEQYGEDIINALNSNDFNTALNDIYGSMQRAVDLETGKISANVELGNASKSLSQMITANASFEGTIPVQVDLDGETIWENQQKISERKSIQYGGVR